LSPRRLPASGPPAAIPTPSHSVSSGLLAGDGRPHSDRLAANPPRQGRSPARGPVAGPRVGRAARGMAAPGLSEAFSEPAVRWPRLPPSAPPEPAGLLPSEERTLCSPNDIQRSPHIG